MQMRTNGRLCKQIGEGKIVFQDFCPLMTFNGQTKARNGFYALVLTLSRDKSVWHQK